MNTININLEIDPANTKVAEALSNLILVMGGASAGKHVNIAKEVKATFEAPTTAKTSVDPANPPAEEIPAIIEPENRNDEGASLEEIREVLGKKVGEHREAIKAKLTELNAKNVTVLSTEHYVDFKAFLDKL